MRPALFAVLGLDGPVDADLCWCLGCWALCQEGAVWGREGVLVAEAWREGVWLGDSRAHQLRCWHQQKGGL